MSFYGLNKDSETNSHSYDQQSFSNSKRSPYDGQYSANSYEQCGYNQTVYEHSSCGKNNIQQFDYNPSYAFAKQDNSQQQQDPFAKQESYQQQQDPFAKQEKPQQQQNPFLVKLEEPQQQQNPVAKQEEPQQQQNPVAKQDNSQQQQNPFAKQEEPQQQQNPFAKQDEPQQQQNPFLAKQEEPQQQQISLNKQEEPQPTGRGITAYSQLTGSEDTYVSKYYNIAYSQMHKTAPAPRLRSDGDNIRTFRDYYDLFAAQSTKKMFNLLLFIVYGSALLMLILGIAVDSFSLLDFAFYIIFGTLLAVTKQGAFAIVLTAYNSLAVLLNFILIFAAIAGGGLITSAAITSLSRSIFVLILSITVSIKLRKLKMAFVRKKYTEIS